MPEPIDAYIHRIGTGDSELITVDMEEAAVDAISGVIRKHNDEFDAALAPFGLSHKDILMPAWQRPMRKADVEALRWLGEPRPPIEGD